MKLGRLRSFCKILSTASCVVSVVTVNKLSHNGLNYEATSSMSLREISGSPLDAAFEKHFHIKDISAYVYIEPSLADVTIIYVSYEVGNCR